MSDLYNEQEQVDAIKGWWKSYGSTLLLAIVLAAIIILGMQWWKKHHLQTTSNASVAYLNLVNVSTQNNLTALDTQAAQLQKDFPKSPYASMGTLVQAGVLIRSKRYTAAISALHWILFHSSDVNLKALAYMRLARLYLQKKEPKKALETLKDMPAAYLGSVDMVRGDAHLMLKQNHQAAVAYRAALKALPETSASFKTFVKMKLNNLPAGS